MANRVANPHFVQWLAELEADTTNENKRFTIAKARKAIRNYPHVLHNGTEAKQLKGIGPMIAGYLDSRMQQAGLATGTDAPLPMPKRRKSVKSNAIPKAAKRSVSEPLATATSSTTAIGNSAPTQPSAKPNQPAASRRASSAPNSRQGQVRLPAKRTGRYALLLGLLDAEQVQGEGCSLRKAELIPYAQPWCNESFTVPSNAGSHYTAWSGMGRLVDDNWVKRSSHPPVFSLTALGRSCAHACKQDLTFTTPNPQHPNLMSKDATSASPEQVAASTSTVLQSSSTSRLTTSSAQPCKCGATNHRRTNSAKCPLNKKARSSALNSIPTSLSTSPQGRLADLPSQDSGYAPSQDTNVEDLFLADKSSSVPVPLDADTHAATSRSVPTTLTPAKTDYNLLSDNTLRQGIRCYAPDEYVVELLLDHRERHLIKMAEKCKLAHTISNLDLGDIVFVATVKASRETLLLPYMIERKTTSDLAASMMDKNRLASQRFRIQQAGIGQPILLIEDVKSDYEPLDANVLKQALANCQVETSLFIKHSSGLRDTCVYLRSMVEFIRYRLQGVTLECHPIQAQHACLAQVAPGCCQSIRSARVATVQLQQFYAMMARNQRRNVQELFAVQLMQLAGCTEQDALAITQCYPTPHRLREAFLEQEREHSRAQAELVYLSTPDKADKAAERRALKQAEADCTAAHPELLLSKLKRQYRDGSYTTQINKPLSAKIYRLYMHDF
eukprot:TRINITY_DN7144_c0_g1_i2.p1 TRINITY_DN7144_c0_g1~~TRINITY_DN7144_c0_g1_i2.p1  ORF type:complete len:727 (+),score=143.91 TRINITY_DN7144_c0_g1_i2:3-2183(+)